MLPVLEAVPNFSAGRDPALLKELVRAAEGAGTEVLDASADADHNRSVLTLVGTPGEIEEAAVRLASLAVEAIDLRAQEGVHPRVGALDVFPVVPLSGVTEADATALARRIGRRFVEELSLPVFFYALASDPPGRGLGELRKGGFEALTRGEARRPDLVPREGPGRGGIHPSAGVSCVGARPLLLAWNVDVEGIDIAGLREVARGLRETDGGHEGLRALGLELERQGRMQLSMNLEDVRRRAPFEVFRALERTIEDRGGRIVRTEVIGMVPDELVLAAAADRLLLDDPRSDRLLAGRILSHAGERALRAAMEVVRAAEGEEEALPARLREALRELKLVCAGARNDTGESPSSRGGSP